MRAERLRRLLAGLLVLLTLSMLLVPAGAADETDEAIHIGSTEEFLDFAASCVLDSWSQGKTFVLDVDISLDGTEFEPIPTFGGTFEGGGHTIRGLNVQQSYAPAGLFCVLQRGAVVQNLNVEGSVAPSGESESVGGIAGENNGSIIGCSFAGTVSGTRNVGGIAGKNGVDGVVRESSTSGALFGENMSGGVTGFNLGLVQSCRNGMYVNIESTDPTIDLSRVNLSFSLDLTQLSRMDTANVATDTGGIAGYSSGTIEACTNLAAIGHQHIGYNVGGIAGRSSGQLRECVNEGSVCGRKDVGGIVGQMEPYIRMELSESTLNQVEDQLKELNDLMDQAASHAEGGLGGVSSRLNQISGYVNSAADAANDIRLTAGIDSVVRGDGQTSSSTQVSAEATPIDASGAHGAEAGVSISHEPGSVTVEVGKDHDAGLTISSSAGAQLNHDGLASGVLSASTQIVAAPELDGLTSAVSGIGNQLALLNGAVSGTAGALAEDVRQINEKYDQLNNTIFDAISDMQNGVSELVVDASSVDVEQITYGKAYACQNTGAIYGDINTGGVAGSMAIEYSLDPEDDVSSDLEGNYRRQYEYRAVLQHCVNTGEITGKRSYVGSVCGRMDLGLITDCEAYGSAKSEDGDYVGGIAGVTAATVRSSYAKCTLSGRDYVGGIVGTGVAEKAGGDSSAVAGCYAMVEISGARQYSGAVSGAAAGSFLENYYVGDNLAGINRQSLAGQAEPVDYEQLLAVENLPEAMQRFTLSFVVDGQTVYSVPFSYGDSFEQEDYPVLPEKDGCSAAWDRDELSELHFDTVVTAVYTPYTPGVASASTRQDGRAIILVEGDYQSGDELTITAEPLTPSTFHIHGGSLGSRVRGFFEDFGEEDFSLLHLNWDDVEQWSITVPSDGQTVHKLRYLAPDGNMNRLRIYAENNGSWETVEYETMGSYLIFPVSGSSARIAVILTVPIWWVWVLAAVVLIGLIVLAVLLIRKTLKRSHGRKASPAPEPDAAAQTEASLSEVEDLPLEQLAGDAADEALLQRARDAEERLAKAEEELRLLREGAAAAPAASEPAAAPQRRKRRWWIPVLVGVLLLAAAAAVLLFFRSGLKDDLEAYRLLKACSERNPLAMELTVDATLENEPIHMTADVFRTASDGTAVTCVEQDNVSLYYANRSVYLENGKAYHVGRLYPDYSELMGMAAELYRLVEVSTYKSDGQKIYLVTAEGDSASDLLALLLPEASGTKLRTLDVELTAEGEILTELRFRADAASTSLDACLRLDTGAKIPAVPEAVAQAIAEGETGESTLTDEFFSLVQAWSSLMARDHLSADIALSADCGPLVVNDTLQYDRQMLSGQSFGCIRRNAVSLYFSDDRFCDETGHTVTADIQSLAASADLIDLAYQLMMNGTAACVCTQTGSLYTLELDETGMLGLACAIAPDIQSQNVTFTSGRLEVTVEDGEITTIGVACGGNLHLVLASTEVSADADITLTDREVSMPQQVINALRK